MQNIMVVDDNAPVREMVRKILERSGYEVQEAKDGKVALELYRQHPSDLIITDLLMPDKDGIETIIEFRKLNRAIKIVAMSGGGRVSSKTSLAGAEKLGAKRSLTKPFTPQELLAVVADVLAEAR